ncbi:MAG: DUF423 domain-containing protein [Planctomycetota bacterium]
MLLAAVAGASAVVIGAFGAHGLEDRLVGMGIDGETIDRRLPQFDTGARYHLAHALAILAFAAAPFTASRLRTTIVTMFGLGIVFFSGSLYLLVLTNTPWLGAVTPIGGVCWIVAWSLLGVLAITSKDEKPNR